MMRFVYFLLCFTFCIPHALATKMYVGELKSITVRTGQGTSHKIIAMIKSGQPVEVLEKGENWSKIGLPNGKTGWVLTRFLTSATPNKLLLEDLSTKYDALKIQADQLSKDNQKHLAENQKLKTDLNQSQSSLKRLNLSYNALRKESAEFLSLQKNYKQTSSELVKQREKAEKLERELSKIKFNQNIRWFLAGAGVLLVGFVIGFSVRRQRRKPSLY
jgi:SH3 domain protein